MSTGFNRRVIADSAIQAALFIAPNLHEYAPILRVDTDLGIGGPAQASNASLAIQLSHAWMEPQNYKGTRASYISIISLASFILAKSYLNYYCDRLRRSGLSA